MLSYKHLNGMLLTKNLQLIIKPKGKLVEIFEFN